MKRKQGLWVSVLCVVLVVLAWGGATLSAQDTAETVRIGILMPPGSESYLAAQLAIRELNSAALVSPTGRPLRFELAIPNTFPTTADAVPGAIFSLNDQGVRAVLGPTNNVLALSNLEPLARAGVPVLTLATADLLTDYDVTNNIMRFRAPEGDYSRAAADYMLNELGLTRVALVQTNIESTEALVAYEFAMGSFGRVPALKVQLEDGANLAQNIPTIVAENPDGIAMWGAAADVVLLLNQLRSAGWNGKFFYRNAQEAWLRGELTVSRPQGIIGANGWSYGTRTQLSRQFMVNYVSDYGKIPGDEAAAAYDAVYTLAGQIQVAGVQMPELYQALLAMPTVFAVQGRLSPLDYGNGDFSRLVALYEIGEFGGSRVLARYQNGERLPDDDLIIEELNIVAAIGTPTFTPTPSPSPTQTLSPTPTPSQVQIRVIATEIDVKEGPGDFFTSIGKLRLNDSATVVGGDSNLDWLVIQYRGGIGWVFNDSASISLFDPSTLLGQLPVIDAPPTPQGGVTATPVIELADIVIDTVTIDPPQPVPGQPFIANVVLRNAGNVATGPFTIAASFEPGAVYSSNIVPNMEPATILNLPLSATVVGSGQFSVDIVADVLNQVNEGFAGEANNFYRVTYNVDFGTIAELNALPVFAGNQIDLAGGIPDLNWTGTELNVMNGALIGIVTGVTYEEVTYDHLNPAVITSSAGLSDAQIFPGVLIGVYTAEGKRAIMRIESRVGTSLTISFKVYGV